MAPTLKVAAMFVRKHQQVNVSSGKLNGGILGVFLTKLEQVSSDMLQDVTSRRQLFGRRSHDFGDLWSLFTFMFCNSN